MRAVLTAIGGFFLMFAGVTRGQAMHVAFDVQSLPSSGVLSLGQVRQLAAYVVKKYGFNVSALELVSIAYIESSFRPWVQRDEGFDKSTGLMQTLLGTAKDLYTKGWTAFGSPTEQTLKKPLVSMYYGAAYLHWLRKHWPNKSQEWYVRAYNGGPGWQSTKNGPASTAAYYSKFINAKNKLGG